MVWQFSRLTEVIKGIEKKYNIWISLGLEFYADIQRRGKAIECFEKQLI